MVINNGFYDDTVPLIEGMNEPRVVLIHTPEGVGHQQDLLSTQAAQWLIRDAGCDWVVPLGADEFWVSHRHGSLRNVLAQVDPSVELIVTDSFQFRETELDDPAEPDPLVRIQHAVREKLPKVLMHGLGDDLEFITLGNDSIQVKGNRHLKNFPIDTDDLVRYHYRQLGVDEFRRRIRNQAEGFLLRYGDRWMGGRNEQGLRIWRWYNTIRQGTFEKEYHRQLTYNREQAERPLEHGELRRVDTLANLFKAEQAASVA